MNAILRLLDWDTSKILAEKKRTPLDGKPFPLDVDWEAVFKLVKPVDGFEWNLLYDSCDGPEDKPKKEGENWVYVGYCATVNNQEYWTQHDDSGRHVDGIKPVYDEEGRATQWKIYDPANDEKRRKAQEYADALMLSPYFYFIKDTGSCQKPTQERVYRVFVDPEDNTKVSMDYWGNLGSTNAPIYTYILLQDVTDKEHLAKVTVQNGKLVIEEQPFYLSTDDFANCFGELFVISLSDDDTDAEALATTNNKLFDAFKTSSSIVSVQSMRQGYASRRKYIRKDNIVNEFKNVLGRQVDPENFTFGELSEIYRNIIQGFANVVNNTEYTSPKQYSSSYVSVGDFRAVFNGIVDDKIDLSDFTLGDVCNRVNEILLALNNLTERA